MKTQKFSPRKNIRAIVIGGSAGSIPVMCKILSGLPAPFTIPLIVCLHRMKNVSEGMIEVFSNASLNPVLEPNDKEEIKKGNVYLAPSNYHMLVEKNNTFSLSTDILVNYSRPSIDLTFQSCSRIFGHEMVAILLTGANKDGVDGMCMAKKNGATTIVQSPDDCIAPYMPQAALEKRCIDHIFSTTEITEYLISLLKEKLV